MAAVTTDTQVCNMALGACGQRDLIGSLLDDTAAGLACATYYSTAKAKVLEAAKWRWASKRQTLALLSGVEREGWGYVYAAPSDLLSIGCVSHIEDGARPPTEPLPFLIELNDTGNAFLIACDVTTPELVYTRDVPVALWPAVAIDALAADLAVRLALMLPVKPQLAASLAPAAAMKLREAQAFNGNTGSPDAPALPPAILARR